MLLKESITFAGIVMVIVFASGCSEKKQESQAHMHESAIQFQEQEHTGMQEETKEGIAQKTCPVMGNLIDDKNLYVDHDGRRIYVCCQSCVEEVKKDPEKYIKKLEEMGEVPETL